VRDVGCGQTRLDEIDADLITCAMSELQVL